jgi:hypothetical protein
MQQFLLDRSIADQPRLIDATILMEDLRWKAVSTAFSIPRMR